MSSDAPLTVTDEWVSDLLTTALEGGSNYWIDGVDIAVTKRGQTLVEQFANGALIRIVYDNGHKSKFIDKESVATGLAVYISDAAKGKIRQPVDLEIPDAEEADVILQYAMFAEVLFG